MIVCALNLGAEDFRLPEGEIVLTSEPPPLTDGCPPVPARGSRPTLLPDAVVCGTTTRDNRLEVEGMAGAQKKSLDAPDERIQFEGISAEIVELGDASVSRNLFQPGAHCALGGRTLAGHRRAEQSCQAHHTGVVLEGRLHIEMDDGSVLEVGPSDVFDIPPGTTGG